MGDYGKSRTVNRASHPHDSDEPDQHGKHQPLRVWGNPIHSSIISGSWLFLPSRHRRYCQALSAGLKGCKPCEKRDVARYQFNTLSLMGLDIVSEYTIG